MKIPVPFLNRPIGAGDAIKTALEKIGIAQKEGCGCNKRQRAANRAVQFIPRDAKKLGSPLPTPTAIAAMRNQWTKPPAIPQGWRESRRIGAFAMFVHESGRIMIWEIRDGHYGNSWGFPSERMKTFADDKFDKLTSTAA